jgi:hypothetical protein
MRAAAFLWCALLWAAWLAVAADSQPANFVANPSFEVAEPPMPTAATKGQPAPADQWLPRTWSVWPMDFAGYSLPDDPAQAHSGRRCVHVQSAGEALLLRYGPIPRFDGQAWTVRFWARGTGKVLAVANELFYGRGPARLKDWTFLVGDSQAGSLRHEWAEHEFQFQPPADCSSWHLDLGNQGASDLWLDDVFVGHPALKPFGLPPEKPAGWDEHTRLYLPFEAPLDEYQFFTEGEVALSQENAGRFGKCLVLGPGGYVACSAGKYLDPAQGTIEFWVKMGFPGNDGVTHPLLLIGGPEGMQICKHEFPHVMFYFTSGFQTLSCAWAETYAQYWQPGVWRHIAACWDKELMELFIDGKLVAWEVQPKLLRVTGDELGIGSAGMELDDLRISNVVRYRVPVGTDGPRRNESFIGGAGRF